MAFRPTFFSSLLHNHAPSPSSFSRNIRTFHARPSFTPRAVAIARPHPSQSRAFSPLGLGIAASLSLFTLSYTLPSKAVKCEQTTGWRGSSAAQQLPTRANVSGEPRSILDEKKPKSIVNTYELSFGAVCGICAGVFVKKGAKALAFLLGGAFVFLQYMSSKSYITVDWAKIGSKYDSAFGTKTPTGVRGPTIGKVWGGFVDFVTANFQQRASFLAGLALGLRLG
ncbi:hypothetical protein L202_01548 [Cryptococcus amylolentus CBS 6039]|uniref:FUN14 domain-containing protein n=2 Tax=Cryptococcus amylolentus TaxID=104669 RepID=A0A1E3I4T5_9TREE|nr:hypothetical protein L202_01548 [Cryptococcus amylolentus CBS 6039]ODN83405.1 hypothetical protein L202_01548 [Cryptococcus amylolentus CBS 6039]ODO10933.1 hypothetical protein I350_01532 [Cryptococcus amylolentus CBS 6273]